MTSGEIYVFLLCTSVSLGHTLRYPDCTPFGKPYSCFINSGFYHSARVLFDSSSLWYIYLLEIRQKHFTFSELVKEAEMQGLRSPLKINEIVNLGPFIYELQLLLINRYKGGTVWDTSSYGSLLHCWEDLNVRVTKLWSLLPNTGLQVLHHREGGAIHVEHKCHCQNHLCAATKQSSFFYWSMSYITEKSTLLNFSFFLMTKY